MKVTLKRETITSPTIHEIKAMLLSHNMPSSKTKIPNWTFSLTFILGTITETNTLDNFRTTCKTEAQKVYLGKHHTHSPAAWKSGSYRYK